ncbi:MAG: sulfatase-like hydrolase/transferase [Planctomycetota bacterium]
MTKKPNLLLVLTDQQSCWTLGCYGGTLIETPHIDRLAAEGMTLDHCITPSAVCTPSRGCLLTGQYPHQHGARHNDLELNRDARTWAHQLSDAGYHTGYAGKWHLDGKTRPGWVHPERACGFRDARFMFNRGHWKKITQDVPNAEPTVFVEDIIGDEESYPTDWLTRITQDFLNDQAQNRPDQPFAFMLSIPDPHGPYRVRKPYDTMYDPAAMPIPETFDQTDLPDWAAELRREHYGRDHPDPKGLLRHNMSQYCGEVKLIDDRIGDLLATLGANGQLDETIVVFCSDHGDYMGEHGLMEKNWVYESTYRVPFIVRYPEAVPRGSRLDRLVSFVDVQSTLLGLMGVPAAGTEAGRDASPLLRGEAVDGWVDEAFLHHASLNMAGIFTDRFELAHVRDSEDSVLFDRREDPLQVNNLFRDPAYAEEIDRLNARILEHHDEVGTPGQDWLRAAITAAPTAR